MPAQANGLGKQRTRKIVRPNGATLIGSKKGRPYGAMVINAAFRSQAVGLG